MQAKSDRQQEQVNEARAQQAATAAALARVRLLLAAHLCAFDRSGHSAIDTLDCPHETIMFPAMGFVLT